MISVYSTADWTEALTGEHLLLSLLGKILYTAPQREWLNTLIRGDVFDELPFGADQPLAQQGLQLMQAWCRKNRAGLTDPGIADLQNDYLALFIGLETVLAPVWESVYLNEDHLLFQEQTLQVRQWYARYGIEIEHMHQEPDDHIALEMMFIAHLAQLGLDSLNHEDEGGFETTLAAQRKFLNEHLLRFAPAWYALVEANAATDFYRGLAQLIWGALQAVAELLMIEIPEGAVL